MAGLLGIDLDSHELRLVELNPSSGGYQLHAALALPAGALDAASLGAQLKSRLQEVGFKATTSVIALSHDAMTCREVRHPDIPANELPAIVQFQVLKETSLPADEAIVDYIPLSQKYSTGELRSLTYVARKSRVRFCEQLCQAADLKLLAVVPRAIALATEILSLQQGQSEATAFACSQSFFVMHQGTLIFNRGMGLAQGADELLSELKRSIAAYSNQANLPPLSALYLAGHELPDEAQRVVSSLPVTVHLYDPYQNIAGAERLAGHGDYAVAAGAAQVTRAFKKIPVEFLAPKKVMPKPNRKRSYALVGGVAAVAVGLLLYGLYWMLTSTADSEIADLQERIKLKRDQEKNFADVEKRFEAVKHWRDHEIFILEEIYDLIDIFPDMAGVQIVKAEWKSLATAAGAPGANPVPGKTVASQPAAKTASIKPIARLTLKATAEQDAQLKILQAALRDSRHWKWIKSDLVPQERNTMVYELEVLPLRPEDYRDVITIGNNITATEGQSNTRQRPGRGFRPTGGRP